MIVLAIDVQPFITSLLIWSTNVAIFSINLCDSVFYQRWAYLYRFIYNHKNRQPSTEDNDYNNNINKHAYTYMLVQANYAKMFLI